MSWNTAPKSIYHWSLRTRRSSILKRGLRINSLSVDGKWRPPYLCFSTSPKMALSLFIFRRGGNTCVDLYEVWPEREWKIRRRDDMAREIRVFNNIPKRRVHFVGSVTLKRKKR